MKLLYRIATAWAVLVLGVGCETPKVVRAITQPAIPSYHEDAADATPMRRVAVLPIDFDQDTASTSNELDLIFHAELTKASAFEVIPISREELSAHFGIPQLSSVQVIPGDLLMRLIQDYNVDGVLFTDVTHYYPYRPIAIGVRCKLVDAHTGVQRWVFDHLFDSGAPEVAGAAKQFAVDEESEQLPIATDGSGILDSPSQFGKYVAHETYRSLLGI
jgi:hypothetical protein